MQVIARIEINQTLTREQVLEFYGYTMERDVQVAMLPKPFVRLVVEENGKRRVVIQGDVCQTPLSESP